MLFVCAEFFSSHCSDSQAKNSTGKTYTHFYIRKHDAKYNALLQMQI